MAKSQRKPSPSTSSELLGARIQKAINAPGAQLARQVMVAKAEHEDQGEWDEIVAAISETEGVTVENQEDGSVHIAWITGPDY